MLNLSSRGKWIALIAPVFLVALVAVFVLLPFPFTQKLDGVCFGI